MKNIIRILTIVLIIALSFAVYLGLQMRNDNMSNMESNVENNLESNVEEDNSEEDVDNIEEYNKIMDRDLNTDYPTSYLELMTYYSEMIKFLYGGTATSEQIANVVEKQRHLYSSEILMLNTYDEQLAYIYEDIANFTKDGNRIFDFEILDIYETNLENSMVEIRVLYRVTKSGNSDMEYYLIKEDGLWKIISFKSTRDIGIIE